jgi:hypothetical protein
LLAIARVVVARIVFIIGVGRLSIPVAVSVAITIRIIPSPARRRL